MEATVAEATVVEATDAEAIVVAVIVVITVTAVIAVIAVTTVGVVGNSQRKKDFMIKKMPPVCRDAGALLLGLIIMDK